MIPSKAAAQRIGALYLLFALLAIVGEFLLPSAFVPGDATATAARIAASETMYRIDAFLGFVTLILFLFLVWNLYFLLRDVDRRQAMLMVLFVSVGVAVALSNMLHKFGPLVLLSGADYLSVFTKPQLDTLSFAFLRLHTSGAAVVTGFWGLWLFPFGILVMRSRFLPRILGILLIIAGVAYVASSFTSIGFPEYRPLVSKIAMPLYFGEVPIILWLLIKGVKVPQPQALSASAP